MKKILVAVMFAAALVLPMAADDGFAWGAWFNVPEKTEYQNVEGIALGLPIISFNKLSGASLALCGNVTERASGFEFALLGFNKSKAMSGVQLALVNLQKTRLDDCTVQIGAYNQTGEKGVQIGFINNGRNNAVFQFGLININKNGWMPVMLFVNFRKGMFD